MANADSTPAAINNPASLPEWGAPDWEAMDSDKFAETLLEKMETEEAILTCEEMDIIERFWESDRLTRRCSLIHLTKSFTWLRENIEKDVGFAEALANTYNCLDPEKYEQIAALLRDSQRRLMCALACREDMQELFAKVGAESEQGINHD